MWITKYEGIKTGVITERDERNLRTSFGFLWTYNGLAFSLVNPVPLSDPEARLGNGSSP